MTKPELLLPAGSLDIAQLAIDHGADAVYVGLKNTSARAKAKNLTLEEMQTLIDYAHNRGAKVFCALNILLFNEELEDCIKDCAKLVAGGLDAFIVQDFGMASLLLSHFPQTEVHASTQMAIMNTTGAQTMEALGFDRVVLARETSLEVMKDIKARSNIDIEVFVQGALCVSYSGLCYMSSFQGDRSGNRGQCAQPCRCTYTLTETGGKKVKDGYLLSPKDMNLLSDLPSLMDCPVESLKIEGRMKQPEYVALMADTYRKHIDRIAEGETPSSKDMAQDTKCMAQVFNREGFSQAYLHGVPGKSMMSYRTPKNTGIPLGKMVRMTKNECSVKLDEPLCLGDGVALYDKNLQPLWGGYVDALADTNGQKAKAFERGQTVVFKHDVKPDALQQVALCYKTFDKDLSKNLLKLRKAPLPKQAVTGVLHYFVMAQEGQVFSVTALYNGNDDVTQSFTWTSDFMVEMAKNGRSSHGVIEEGLSKLSSTSYEAGNVEIIGPEGVFVPMSVVTKAKNEIVAHFDQTLASEEATTEESEERLSAAEYIENAMEALDEIPPQIKMDHAPLITVQVRTLAQARAAIEAGADELNVLLMDTYRHDGLSDDEIISLMDETTVICSLPPLVKDMKEEDYYRTRCKRLAQAGIKHFMIANLGQAMLLEESGVEYFAGDYMLNLTNDLTAMALSQIGIDRQTLSLEIDAAHIEELSAVGNVPLEMVVYGKLPAMNTRYCPMGSLVGKREVDKPCSKPCVKMSYALEREEKRYQLASDQFCNVYLLGAETYSLFPHIQNVAALCLDYWRIAGAFMEADELKDAVGTLVQLRHQTQNGDKKVIMPLKTNTTQGHFIKGVR